MIKEYLSSLHTRSVHHQKRFSLIVSGCFTLLIFAFWVSIRFGTGGSGETVAAVSAADTAAQAASPLESLRASASESWSLLTGELNKAKDGLKSVDLQDSYTQVRNDALHNQYGQ